MTAGVRMLDGVRVRFGGTGQRVLLLLHGLGATGAVWNGWHAPLSEHWSGRWLAPDLPGHGGSRPLDRYSFESLAAGVARVLEPDDRVLVLGHSLGGVLGVVLAGGLADRLAAGPAMRGDGAGGGGSGDAAGGGSGGSIDGIIGLGVKVAWTPDELARVGSLAHRPIARFASRAEAVDRYLRVSGLAGLLDARDSGVDAGVREDDGQWRLAMDPRAFGVGAPDMAGLLAAATAPVFLARGEHDPMVSDEDLARLGVPATTLPGLGHNAHVEDPEAVLRLLHSSEPDGP